MENTRLAKEKQGLDVEKIDVVMYAMASKFLDSVTTEELKEAIGMTQLGQLIYNDGVEKGIMQGSKEAKLEIAKNLLNDLPDEKIAEKTGLSLETIIELHNN